MFQPAVLVHRRLLAIAVDSNVIQTGSQKLLQVCIEINHLIAVLRRPENTQFPSIYIDR